MAVEYPPFTMAESNDLTQLMGVTGLPSQEAVAERHRCRIRDSAPGLTQNCLLTKTCQYL